MNKSLKAYIDCRMVDITEDLKHSDQREVLLACLYALERLADKLKKGQKDGK